MEVGGQRDLDKNQTDAHINFSGIPSLKEDSEQAIPWIRITKNGGLSLENHGKNKMTLQVTHTGETNLFTSSHEELDRKSGEFDIGNDGSHVSVNQGGSEIKIKWISEARSEKKLVALYLQKKTRAADKKISYSARYTVQPLRTNS